MTNEKFIHTKKLKMASFICMGIGLLSFLIALIRYQHHPERIWANLLLDSVFFLGISMASAFLIAAVYVAYGGWLTVIKRVPEAISSYIPYAVVFLLIVLVFGGKYLYEWRNAGYLESDEVLKGKSAYFNPVFYWGRFVFFLGILISLNYLIRRRSIMEDNAMPGDITHHKKSVDYASLFLIFFAVYISVSSWDWLMSIDVHWFSTMYGWYVFASFWVTGISVVALFVIYLRSRGYLKQSNKNHLNMLGIMMFAFSIFWTYVTFDQFMLIWYANIPEETVYFKERFMHFRFFFYGLWIMNFVLPFLILISRDAKRKHAVMVIAALIIIFGHFVDFWLMIMPKVVGPSAHLGWFELSLPLFFIGFFTYMVFNYMSKYNLVPTNHPFLKESIHYEY